MTEFNLSHTKHKFQLSVDMLFHDTIHQTHGAKFATFKGWGFNSDLRFQLAFVSSNVQAVVDYSKMRIIENRTYLNAVNQWGVIVKTESVVNWSKGEAGKTRILIDMFRSKISNSGKTVGDTMKLERKAVEWLLERYILQYIYRSNIHMYIYLYLFI